MAIHQLKASQFVARPLEEVFAFFAEPRNLARLTPSNMGFEFLSDDFEMREGLEIDYRLRPLFGIPARWRTRITRFDPPNGFVDVQLSGPYAKWEHRHTFRAVEGGTQVLDEITYRLPLGVLGEAGGSGLVRSELERIFRYRARAIDSIFAVPATNDAPHTVAVAGGTGFVGGAIAMELFQRGHRVIVLSHNGESGRGSLPDSIQIRQVDVSRDDGVPAGALDGVDALVISLAFPNLPIEAPQRGRTFMAVDAAGAERLVAAAQAANVGHVIYMSGAGAAPNARHWFRAKWRAEEAIRASGIPWTIVRPTWIYGPRDVSLNRFIGFARRLPFVPMTNFGRQLLAPVFVDDVARLVADAIANPAARDQVFELGGPETMPMRRIIWEALRAAGTSRPIVPGPAPLIKLGVAPLTVLPSPPMTPDAIDFINQPATVDVAPLLERMPRRLTPLREGLATYLTPDSGPGELHLDGRQIRSAA